MSESKFSTVITSEDGRSFRLFVDAADKLARCRLLREVTPEAGKMTWTRETGWVLSPEDEDDFRSCLVLARKLLLEKEPTYLYKVLSALGKYARAEHRQELRSIKAEFQQIEETFRGVRYFIGPDEVARRFRQLSSESPVPGDVAAHFISPKQLRETMFNSGLFHEDATYETKRELLRAFEPVATKLLFVHVFDVSRFASKLAEAMREGGFLAPNPGSAIAADSEKPNNFEVNEGGIGSKPTQTSEQLAERSQTPYASHDSRRAFVKLQPQRCSTVLVGSWNLAIFSPQWTARRLFEKEELDLDVAWGEALMLKFKDEEAELWVRAGAVQLRPRADAAQNFDRVATLTRKTLSTLAETPLRAFGINFSYDLDVLDVAGDSMRQALSSVPPSLKQALKTVLVQHKLEVDDLTVKLTLVDGPSRGADVNFHFELAPSEARRPADIALELLDKHPISALRQRSDSYVRDFGLGGGQR